MNQPPDRRDLPERLRKAVGGALIRQTFAQLANLGRLHPRANPQRHKVEVTRDVPYKLPAAPYHVLDIYKPTATPPPWPVALYVHGGAFHFLSKDTHWLMGLALARHGYLTFNINYRLAPQHPFPAAIEDTCAALAWVHENAGRYGGDLDRLILAGESAGANLVTSAALATAFPFPLPEAAHLFDLGVQPRVVLAACGVYEVDNVERFARNPAIPRFVYDRIVEVREVYLARSNVTDPAIRDLANPLHPLERGQQPQRPLPAFFLPCGTHDPLVADNRRLELALRRLNVPHLARYYPGELHAFHAFLWRPQARQCWREWFEFADHILERPVDEPYALA